MSDIIKPEDVTNINKMSSDDIANMSEQVMKADKVLGDVTMEMENLSNCIYSLNQTKEKYDKVARHVKSQMRTMATKL